MLRCCLLRLTSVLVVLTFLTSCSKSPAEPTEPAPVITEQPQDQSITIGSTATLTVAATGSSPLSYQWYRGRSGDIAAPIDGGTEPSYITPPLTASAQFWVRVTAGTATADSETATVAVSAIAPSITAGPRNEAITSGGSTQLFVEVTGTEPFTYQWFRGPSGSTSDPIDGATRPRLDVSPSSTTQYWVRISNAGGSVDSPSVTVTVSAPAPPPAPAPAPPPTAPAPDSSTTFENQVLALINQARVTGGACGGATYPAVPVLAMNGSLRAAARAHSQDMATRNYLSHTSPEGSTFMQRIAAAGFSGSGPFAENIGGGYDSPAAVVAGWMSSADHCRHVMGPGFRLAGVGYAYRAGTAYGSYWTLNLAGQ
jgi:uncharacterized protein YkwD